MTLDAVRPCAVADPGSGLGVPAPSLVPSVLPVVAAATPMPTVALVALPVLPVALVLADVPTTVALDVLAQSGSGPTGAVVALPAVGARIPVSLVLDAPADVLAQPTTVLPGTTGTLDAAARAARSGSMADVLPVWLPDDGGAADDAVAAFVWLRDDDAAAAPSASAGVFPLGADVLGGLSPTGALAVADHPALRLVAWPRRGGKSTLVAALAATADAARGDAAARLSEARGAAIGDDHAW